MLLIAEGTTILLVYAHRIERAAVQGGLRLYY